MLKREQAARQNLLEEEEARERDEAYNKTAGATTAITHTSMPRSEGPSGTQTVHPDDKTETMFERGTEAATAMALNQ